MQFRVAGAGEGAILNGNYREERTFPAHREHRRCRGQDRQLSANNGRSAQTKTAPEGTLLLINI